MDLIETLILGIHKNILNKDLFHFIFFFCPFIIENRKFLKTMR